MKTDYTKEENEQYFSEVPATLPFRPCIGCGYCCKTAPCPLAMSKYKTLEPWKSGEGCPSLYFDTERDRYYCQLVLDTQGGPLSGITRDILHIGAGCCSPLNSTRREKLRCRSRSTGGLSR